MGIFTLDENIVCLFYCSDFLKLGGLSCGSCFTLTYPYAFSFSYFKHTLLPQTIRCSRAVRCLFPAPVLELVIFLRSPDSSYWRVVLKNKICIIGMLVGAGIPLFLCPQLTKWGISVCIFTCECTHICTSRCIHLCPKGTWCHTDVSNFNGLEPPPLDYWYSSFIIVHLYPLCYQLGTELMSNK